MFNLAQYSYRVHCYVTNDELSRASFHPQIDGVAISIFLLHECHH